MEDPGPLRFFVQRSPAGGYLVMLECCDRPVSRHDTEEEARERLAAYLRGATAAATPARV